MIRMADLERLYPVGIMCVLPDSQHPSEFFPGQWSEVGKVMVKTLKDKTVLPSLYKKYSEDEYEFVPAILWQRTA